MKLWKAPERSEIEKGAVVMLVSLSFIMLHQGMASFQAGQHNAALSFDHLMIANDINHMFSGVDCDVPFLDFRNYRDTASDFKQYDYGSLFVIGMNQMRTSTALFIIAGMFFGTALIVLSNIRTARKGWNP